MKFRFSLIDSFLESLNVMSGTMTFCHGEGCPALKYSGYQGRVGLFELMDKTDAVRRLVVTKVSSMAIKSAAAQTGFKTMRKEGLITAAGSTTISGPDSGILGPQAGEDVNVYMLP